MSKEVKIKEPIRIRTKKLNNGNESIYLDIYVDGKRNYEFLKLYLVPEKDRATKNRNAETMKLANAIKAQKIVEIQNNRYGFSNSKNKSNIKLIDYIQYIADKDVEKTGRKVTSNTLIHHLKRYDKTGVTFKQLDKEYIIGFVEYLKTAKQQHCKKEKYVSPNTRAHYYKMLRYCINYAVTEDILPANPMDKIKLEDKPKQVQAKREFLTIDELKILIKTDVRNNTVKRAFLFCCFCGIRHCDVAALTWGDLKEDNEGKYTLNMVQQKTKIAISIPLSGEAVKQLPPKGNAKSTDKVFADLISLGRTNEILPKWAESAGIDKHLTFHVSRHTHATMMITLGADLYTVSKLLGHTNIQVTQIYAKIVDESKKKAIDLIPNFTD